MTKVEGRKSLPRNTLLSAMAFLALLACVEPAWAILGVWRRTAVRTAVVVGTVETAAVVSSNASKEAAATAQAQSAADASAAAAKQAQQSATQAAAQAKAATATKTPQQKLQELQSLYDQKLISQSDYEAGKKKILGEVTN
jgi:membrane protease subunit (stomatin/prohibitin family)